MWGKPHEAPIHQPVGFVLRIAELEGRSTSIKLRCELAAFRKTQMAIATAEKMRHLQPLKHAGGQGPVGIRPMSDFRPTSRQAENPPAHDQSAERETFLKAWILWHSLSAVALRIIIVWLYENAGRRVLIAMIFHAMINLSWAVFPEQGSHYDLFVTLMILAPLAAVIATVWSRGQA